MKNSIIIGFLLFFSLSAVVISCSKKSVVSASSALILSKSVVKIGEPLVVTTGNHTSGSSVRWSVSPSTNSWNSAAGDSATFLFTKPGNYQVTGDSSSSAITVTDSIYTDTATANCNSLKSVPIGADDQITLTPYYFSDSAGLVLIANTKNAYGYDPTLVYGGNFSGAGGGLECAFTSVTEYPCAGVNVPMPAMAYIFISSFSDKTYDLIIKLNGTTYQGSVTISNSSVTFNWNYTSGVTISPLTIQKM